MRRIEASHKVVKGLDVENFMVKTTILRLEEIQRFANEV
jgi:hypothetical protein